jgi:hypothetical protein
MMQGFGWIVQPVLVIARAYGGFTRYVQLMMEIDKTRAPHGRSPFQSFFMGGFEAARLVPGWSRAPGAAIFLVES